MKNLIFSFFFIKKKVVGTSNEYLQPTLYEKINYLYIIAKYPRLLNYCDIFSCFPPIVDLSRRAYNDRDSICEFLLPSDSLSCP